MTANQQQLNQLKSYEQEIARYRNLFPSDGAEDEQNLVQLSRIEAIITRLREQLSQTDDGTESTADLSHEHDDAVRFVSAWKQALAEVASQVGSIRKAMAPMRDEPSVTAVYYALADYDGIDNVQREFPDLDLSKLAEAAARNDRTLYDLTLRQTAMEIAQARTELTELRPLLNGLDENPFGVKTNADDTVTNVLEEIAAKLGV